MKYPFCIKQGKALDRLPPHLMSRHDLFTGFLRSLRLFFSVTNNVTMFIMINKCKPNNYMNKTRNIVTVYVTLLSQIQSCFCDIFVTKTAVNPMKDSIISMTLRIGQGGWQKFCELKNERAKKIKSQPIPSFFHPLILSSKPVFVRSMFAHCSLYVRFKSEGTAFILNSNSDLNKLINTINH
jgi:hypothetical protein